MWSISKETKGRSRGADSEEGTGSSSPVTARRNSPINAGAWQTMRQGPSADPPPIPFCGAAGWSWQPELASATGCGALQAQTGMESTRNSAHRPTAATVLKILQKARRITVESYHQEADGKVSFCQGHFIAYLDLQQGHIARQWSPSFRRRPTIYWENDAAADEAGKSPAGSEQSVLSRPINTSAECARGNSQECPLL